MIAKMVPSSIGPVKYSYMLMSHPEFLDGLWRDREGLQSRDEEIRGLQARIDSIDFLWNAPVVGVLLSALINIGSVFVGVCLHHWPAAIAGFSISFAMAISSVLIKTLVFRFRRVIRKQIRDIAEIRGGSL